MMRSASIQIACCRALGGLFCLLLSAPPGWALDDQGSAPYPGLTAEPAISAMLESPDPQTRAIALEGLGPLRTDTALKKALGHLLDERPVVHQSARALLLDAPPPLLTECMLADFAVMKQPESGIWESLLPEMRSALGEPLVECALNEAESVQKRAVAVYCLGRIHASDAAPELLQLTWAQERDLAYAAAEALAGLGDSRAFGRFMELSYSPDMRLRWAAVQGLYAIGGPRVLSRLQAIVTESLDMSVGMRSDVRIRKEAALMLGELGGESSIHVLMRALARDRNLEEETCLALTRLTQQPFGVQPSLWHDWYQNYLKQKQRAESPEGPQGRQLDPNDPRLPKLPPGWQIRPPITPNPRR